MSSTPYITSDFNIATGFFEVIEEQSPTPSPIPRNNNDPPFPPSPSKDTLETESIYPPTHQCKKNSTDPARDILKASTRNARVTRARAKRHSTLFGDGEKPGLAESVVMPSDTSLDASNVFVRTEAQQGRICHARTIRHQKLFGSKIEAAPTKSDGVESTLVIAALDVPVGQNIVEELNVTATEPDLDASSDFSYFTVESYDDLPTPPSTPPKRARIVKSDSYGGYINYSHRCCSRDFEDIMLRMKQLCENSSNLAAAQDPPIHPSLGS